jgi:DNA (cytosine-5)-methyltransferase 1
LIDLADQPDPEQPWGPHQAAADHWARITGRTPPPPAATGPKGRALANPAAVEWVMGLPNGWVTDPGLGLSRRAQIKALGNGVVPGQAVLALRVLLNAAHADDAQRWGAASAPVW